MPGGAGRICAVTARLARAGCVAAEEEAAELVGAAADDTQLEGWLVRREAGEPLAWITGSAAFAGVRVRVDHGVFVPRAQSEELVVRAAAAVPAGGGLVADLCCGCGAVGVAVAAAAPGARVVGVDIDPRAVANARANGIAAVLADLGRPLAPGIFDVVVAVPPYVPTGEMPFLAADVVRFEPVVALEGGEDGLDVVRRVVAHAGELLGRGGSLLVEVGGDQGPALGRLLASLGFVEIVSWSDDDGDLRGVAARSGR